MMNKKKLFLDGHVYIFLPFCSQKKHEDEREREKMHARQSSTLGERRLKKGERDAEKSELRQMEMDLQEGEQARRPFFDTILQQPFFKPFPAWSSSLSSFVHVAGYVVVWLQPLIRRAERRQRKWDDGG